MMISVSIVTYNNSLKEICNCLSSFIDNEEIKVVCIFDNSENAILTRSQVEGINKKLRYASDSRNLGYGHGHNEAFKLCSNDTITDYHIIMNLDVEVTSKTITKLFSYMEYSKKTLHCMPKIVNPDGTIQRACKKLPSPTDLILRRFFGKWEISKNNQKKYEIWDYDYSYILNCPYLSGCFMMVRTESFVRVGMFDTQFFMYPEDIDLTRRLHLIGKTECYPFTSVIHQHEKASYKYWKMTWVHIKSMYRYFNKWGWFIDKQRKMLNKNLVENIKNSNRSCQ